MKRFTLGIVLSAALLGCSDKDQLPAQPTPEKQAAADVAAGKAFAARECKACHGLDGKGAAPGIPHLAAQRERYLLGAMQAYKEGKRTHAALRELVTRMSDADALNVAAYYASLPAVQSVLDKEASLAFGAVTANYRIDGRTVPSVVAGERLDTGRLKLGLMLGAGGKIAVNASTMPGVKIGAGALIGPGIRITRDVPDGARVLNEETYGRL